MSNEIIKEKLSNLRELFKWYLIVLMLTFAGTVSMLLRATEKENFTNIFFSIGGFTLVVIFLILARATWMDMEKLIKDMK